MEKEGFNQCVRYIYPNDQVLIDHELWLKVVSITHKLNFETVVELEDGTHVNWDTRRIVTMKSCWRNTP